MVVALLGGDVWKDLSAQEAGPRALIVEAVENGSAGHKAGIRPGDMLTSWERAASPPANPAATSGDFVSPFDLGELEAEQAPRGPVTLFGSRGSAPLEISVPVGRWQITARPAMAPDLSEIVARARALAAAGDLDQAVSLWRDAASEAARRDNDGSLPAWLLLQAATALRDANRLDDAHAAIREGVAFAERSRNRAAIAALHDAQAQTYERQKDFGRAETSYRAAMAVRQQMGTGSLGAAKSLVDIAFLAIDQNDFATAERTVREALEIQQTLAPGSLVVARTLANLARLVNMGGDGETAALLVRRAIGLLERVVPDTADLANALNNLGTLLRERGDLQEAAAVLARALAIQERLDPSGLDVAISLQNLGLVADNRGHLAEAERLYRRTLSVFEQRASGTVYEATALNNLATLLVDRGDLLSAEEYYLRSLAIREQIWPDGLEVAASLNNLGHLSSQRSDTTRANDYYERSLALVKRLASGSLQESSTLNNLGLVAAQRNDLATAEKIFRQALAIKQRHAPGSALVATTLTNLGDLAETRRDLPAARELYEAARGILEEAAPEGLDMATVLGNLADVADLRGDSTEATRLADRALALTQQLAPESDTHAGALQRLGRYAFTNGNLDRAAGFFERSIDALESQTTRLGGSDEARSGFAGQSHDYYVDYIETLLALDQPARAFEVLERSRARAFLMVLAERDLVLDSDLSPELAQATRELNEEYDRLQESLTELNPGRQSADVDRLQTRLRDLRESRARIIDKIRGASPRLAALQYPTPLTLGSMQQALDPGTTLLSYHIGKEKSRLFVVEPAAAGKNGQPRLTVHTIPVGEAALREQVESVRRQIERQAGSRDVAISSFVELSRRLYDVLIAPAESALATADRVVISPDGPLHSLPFAALVRSSGDVAGAVDRPWQYLVEWKPLHTAVSATVYEELKKRRPVSPEPPMLVAFGDPQYPPSTRILEDSGNLELRGMLRRGFTLEPLPSTRTEVEALGRAFGDRAATYLGADATEARAKSIGKTRYVHFATHGLLDARFPLNSALALSMPMQRREGEDNGLLQAWEIFEQLRIDADLVTLSACETALGAELAGEGLMSLTRAFHYAGARSVLASLWSVADDSTANLMSTVYRHLQAGVPKDEALRRAQLEAISKGQTSAPFHWAAFTLSGDWR